MVETSAEVLPALPQFSESAEGGEQKQRYFGGFQSRCSSTSDACRYHVIEIDGPMECTVGRHAREKPRLAT